jgi:hypothetical protein
LELSDVDVHGRAPYWRSDEAAMLGYARWMLRFPLALGLLLVVSCGDSGSQGGGGGGGGGSGAGAAGAGAAGASGGGGSDGGGGTIDVPEGCSLITQASDAELSSARAVLFDFEPSAGGGKREVVVVTPVKTGVTALELNTFNGFANGVEVTSVAIYDAVTDLINYEPGDMDGKQLVAVAGSVTIEAAPDYATQFKGRIRGTLSEVVYRELDEEGNVIPDGDCVYLHAAEFDAADYDAMCEVSFTGSGACFADYLDMGHECNPITNEPCAADEACDLLSVFECVPAGDAGLCEPCSNTDMQFCRAGMTCDADFEATGKCFKFCCTDDDCGTNGECIAYPFVTNLGVCLEKPAP